MATLRLGPQGQRRSRPIAWLVILNGPRAGADLRMRASTTIGREPDNGLVLEDESVSRYHARAKLERGRYVLYDLASSTGTYVNERRVQRQTLEDGDAIRVGRVELKFKQT